MKGAGGKETFFKKARRLLIVWTGLRRIRICCLINIVKTIQDFGNFF